MTRISLTPIIDVVFILLIFFMLASNFNKIGELKMDMSKETSQSSNEDIKIIKLAVEQANSVISNGKRYDDGELLTMIRLAIKEAKRYSIVLTAKDDVTYQRYLTIMSYLKENKIENVTIGIKANKKRIQEHLDNSLMLVTALAPHIGYDNAAKIAKTALKNNTTLKYETLKTGLISEKDYNKIVDPKKMIYPA